MEKDPLLDKAWRRGNRESRITQRCRRRKQREKKKKRGGGRLGVLTPNEKPNAGLYSRFCIDYLYYSCVPSASIDTIRKVKGHLLFIYK